MENEIRSYVLGIRIFNYVCLKYLFLLDLSPDLGILTAGRDSEIIQYLAKKNETVEEKLECFTMKVSQICFSCLLLILMKKLYLACYILEAVKFWPTFIDFLIFWCILPEICTIEINTQ